MPLSPLCLPRISLACLIFGATCLGGITGALAEKNRFNLSEEKPKPRFPLTEKDWPAKVGEASICLWSGDKLAALSIGVDDNFAGEIDWWKEMAERYDFKVTWFIITGKVGIGNSNGGKWEQFRELEQLGHGVESHTVTHIHPEEPGWGGMEWEYRESKEQIEKNLPGKTVSALAYPGGKNTKLNDRNLVAKYYRVARAARATANPANQIDYMAVNAMSSWNLGDSEYGWANVRNILDKNLYRGLGYRGWAVIFAHGVAALKEAYIPTFEFIKENRENLWVGLFADVAAYGQERDTATLKVESVTTDAIDFLLTDEMDDSFFRHPLTVKVRVPDEWKSVHAMQAGKEIKAERIEHEGAAYALVDAVPDAGRVSVTQ